MITYSHRAVPWGLLGVGAALLIGLLRLVERSPYVLWPLQGTAVGLLAGIAVWCYREPAASLIDTLPRGLRWRTTARSTGPLLLLVVWLLALRWTSTAYFGHTWDIAWQGGAAMICAIGFMTWTRSRGSTGPARAASAAIVGVALAVSLARPGARHVPIFPYTSTGDWQTSRVLWGGAAVAILLLPVLTTRRPRARGIDGE
ncbi:hypothetical protein OG474_36630 [Kribbella sp. NBC_01505]|uniref:hypothetical protein n=1 Tax=Kribbella sp. NBC_01505 TaxID=2903580 RepID=UPI00386E3095